ncbi:pyrroloquinoline quinone biosynthesis protein PqqB [Pseudonocardiaceae bacterium YIM PH 21723]|nr:pyrroloquinoline quinone biosynthesis protein PqqB [Pseudonocardiaceae bacterium YIM PH 21723]
MRLMFLGTAAGGACPQWNCGCRLCLSGLPPRAQDCLAIAAGAEWLLLNASPDLTRQLTRSPLRPPADGRGLPIAAVLLTDAELDHSLGLLQLREDPGLPVYAPCPALEALRPFREILACYGSWTWHPSDEGLRIGPLHIDTVPLSDKRPRYTPADAHMGALLPSGGSKAPMLPTPDPWVVGYRILDSASGRTVLYAPCFREWTRTLAAAVESVDLAILDGTFFSTDELGPHRPDQKVMGHLPVLDSLPLLPASTRVIYTHLNNTNPLLDPQAPEQEKLGRAEVAEDLTVMDIG